MSKKKKSKQKSNPGTIQCINSGIFYANILFIYNYEHDEAIKALKKEKCHDWIAGLEDIKDLFDQTNCSNFAAYRSIYNKKTNEDKQLYYIVRQKKFNFTDDDYCVLAHEVVHLCQFILRDILNRNKEVEAEAYLHTHLMTQCLNHIRSTEK